MFEEQGVTVVTILVPCRNGNVAFFKSALDSVLNQSDSRWKLLIIDDGAPTDLIHVVNALADERITILKNASNFITGALNTGMKLASTPYVSTLHCDDLLDEKAIETLNRYIARHPEIDFFHSSRVHIDENGKPVSGILQAIESFTLSDFKDGGPVKLLTCWKVKSALAIGGMDESLGLHGADDYDFSWCMAEAGYLFKAMPECLYYHRDHREHYRLTTHVSLDTQIRELEKIFRKHGLTDEEINRQIQRRTAGYLRQALFLNEEDKERKEKERYDIRQGWRQKYP